MRLQRPADNGFADCYTYVGDEKYRKALVSQRRAEYRFCSLVPAKCDDGTPIFEGPGGGGHQPNAREDLRNWRRRSRLARRWRPSFSSAGGDLPGNQDNAGARSSGPPYFSTLIMFTRRRRKQVARLDLAPSFQKSVAVAGLLNFPLLRLWQRTGPSHCSA